MGGDQGAAQLEGKPGRRTRYLDRRGGLSRRGADCAVEGLAQFIINKQAVKQFIEALDGKRQPLRAYQ
jgi:hypothetical protein